MSGQEKRKFIVDTDVGMDDVNALIMALSRTDIDIIAITTVFGNTTAEQAAKNANRTLSIMDKKTIPVFIGENTPLVESSQEHIERPFFGKDGLGDLTDIELGLDTMDQKATVTSKGPHAIVDMLKKNHGVTLVCIGPLTNIAVALKIDQSIADSVERVVILGGNSPYVGNAVSVYGPSFNFKCDPEAAHNVLSLLGSKVTCIPRGFFLNQTCSEDFVRKYTSGGDTKKAIFIQTIMKRIMQSSSYKFGLSDEIAMAVAIDDKIIQGVEKRANTHVELSQGDIRGLTRVDISGNSKKKATMNFVYKVDMSKIEGMLLDSLKEPNPGFKKIDMAQ